MRENLEKALKAMFDEGKGMSVPEEDVKELQEETGMDLEEAGVDADIDNSEAEDEDAQQEEQIIDESDDLMQFSRTELISQANDLYQLAQQNLQNGDFASYGETINELGEVLNQLTRTGE
jgi:hypothetical protein